MDENRKFDITPRTKIAELLNRYPQLEETLIEIAPAFKKLRNPILRKTIAKVTSLGQAAKVGNISLGELINRLRREAGLEASDIGADISGPGDSSRPDWLDDTKIVNTIDARPMLDAGEQPLGPVMSALRKLEGDQILKLVTPFLPAPIIDQAKQKGYVSWSSDVDHDEILTFFRLIQ